MEEFGSSWEHLRNLLQHTLDCWATFKNYIARLYYNTFSILRFILFPGQTFENEERKDSCTPLLNIQELFYPAFLSVNSDFKSSAQWITLSLCNCWEVLDLSVHVSRLNRSLGFKKKKEERRKEKEKTGVCSWCGCVSSAVDVPSVNWSG